MEQTRLQQEEPAIDEKVVARLSSKKAAERAKAEQALAQVSQEKAVEDLLALLNREAQKRKKRIRFYIGFLVFYVVLMVLMAATGHGENIGSFSGVFGAFASMAAFSQLQKNAAKALANYDDIRVVGALTEALESQDKNVIAVAEQKLIQLLPRLRASDAGLLNEEQRKILNKTLPNRKKPGLAIAILKAYEQVGDEKALAVVEKIANGEGRAAPGVKEAARVCLPALQKRAENERAARTLLRPSAAPDDPSGILLRPAQGVGETDPGLLLRPVMDEETIARTEETGRPAPNLEAQDAEEIPDRA
jgi:HEAT repeat protein